MKVVDIQGKVYSDQTGRSPIISSRGNKYDMIIYDYNSNNIITECLKSRTIGDIKAAYHITHTILCNHGLQPKIQLLDNKSLDQLKVFMSEVDEKFQLVSPHIHRRNAVERAIQIYKNHFIVGLASVKKTSPCICGID